MTRKCEGRVRNKVKAQDISADGIRFHIVSVPSDMHRGRLHDDREMHFTRWPECCKVEDLEG